MNEAQEETVRILQDLKNSRIDIISITFLLFIVFSIMLLIAYYWIPVMVYRNSGRYIWWAKKYVGYELDWIFGPEIIKR